MVHECPVCMERYSSIDNLREHFETEHPDWSPGSFFIMKQVGETGEPMGGGLIDLSKNSEPEIKAGASLKKPHQKREPFSDRFSVFLGLTGGLVIGVLCRWFGFSHAEQTIMAFATYCLIFLFIQVENLHHEVRALRWWDVE